MIHRISVEMLVPCKLHFLMSPAENLCCKRNLGDALYDLMIDCTQVRQDSRGDAGPLQAIDEPRREPLLQKEPWRCIV